jgi:hypothetical protein
MPTLAMAPSYMVPLRHLADAGIIAMYISSVLKKVHIRSFPA